MKTNDNSATNAVSVSYLLIETEAFEYRENAQARLFANNIQTCVVLITAVGRNSNGEVVPIPDNANVSVVPYTSAPGGWTSNSTPAPLNIQPFPEHINTSTKTAKNAVPAQDARPEHVQVFRRYIRYQGVPDATTIQFAAQVKVGTTTYVSNQRDVPYGGAGQNGRYNSSFRLKSVRPPEYATYNGGLQVTGPVEVFNGLVDDYTTKIDNWYASLRYPGTSVPVAVLSSPGGANASSLHENKATAFGDAGNTAAKKNIPRTKPGGGSLPVGVALDKALNPIRQTRTGVVVVAVGMFARVNVNDYFPTGKQSSVYTGAQDVYGNPVNLAVTLTSTNALHNPWHYQLSVDWAGTKAQDTAPPNPNAG